MEEGRWRRMLGEALPGVSLDNPREREKKPCGCCGSCCRGRVGTKARRREGQEQDRSAHPCHHLGDTMQRQAHGRYREDGRTWATSKKKCFSIALRHTLVVLEMH